MNGIVSFASPVTSYDTRGFPTSALSVIGTDAIMPFWADANGFFVGSVKHRPAVVSELQSFAQTLVAARSSLTSINLSSAYLFEWDDVSPCGCYFPVSIFVTFYCFLELRLISHSPRHW